MASQIRSDCQEGRSLPNTLPSNLFQEDGNDLFGWSSDYKREHFYFGCPNKLHKDGSLCALFMPTSWAVRATIEQFPNFLFPAIEQFPTWC